ncbi:MULTISPECIES: hypothetical protein [Chitinophagaceae]
MYSEKLKHIARFFSVVGHPLLTISVLVYYLSHKELPEKNANLVSMMIIGGIAFPIVVHNLWKTNKGQYTNFDVSNRQQRKGFFFFAIGLLVVVSLYFWCTHISQQLLYSMWTFLAMVVLFALVNTKSKISMHAGVNFYIAAILLHDSPAMGASALVLAILVGASRLLLMRHTLPEIVVGGCIGFAFGWFSMRFL